MNAFDPTLLIYLLGRYIHIVSATLLVGGTLFYEMVVPIAIDELRPEQQLLVFARARWVFKWIVWTSVVMTIFSGVLSTESHWQQYANDRLPAVTAAGRAGWWWAAHASTGIVALMIALSLTIGSVPPTQPIRWMRLNLVILLLVMFFGTVTRHARILEYEWATQTGQTSQVSNP